jgi:hypothetical protein
MMIDVTELQRSFLQLDNPDIVLGSVLLFRPAGIELPVPLPTMTGKWQQREKLFDYLLQVYDRTLAHLLIDYQIQSHVFFCEAGRVHSFVYVRGDKDQGLRRLIGIQAMTTAALELLPVARMDHGPRRVRSGAQACYTQSRPTRAT